MNTISAPANAATKTFRAQQLRRTVSLAHGACIERKHGRRTRVEGRGTVDP